MKKKLFSVAALVLMSIAAVVQPASAADTKKDLRFVIVPKVVHPWFDEVNKGAQDYAKKLEGQLGVKVTVDYVAPQSADVTVQNSILETAAATRPDGIAVDPLDAVGNKKVLDEIRKRGIPVIIFDSPAPEGSGYTSVSNDLAFQASVAAERLVKLLGGKGKVAVMQGFPTAPGHQTRYAANLAVLKKYPGITIVDGGISNDDIQTAQSQAAAVIARTPDLAGYLMCDAAAPLGIASALKEAGKVGKIKVVGLENLKPILDVVKAGVIESTTSTIPKMQGSMAVLMLWQASIGVKIPQVIDTGIEVVTQENVDQLLKEAR